MEIPTWWDFMRLMLYVVSAGVGVCLLLLTLYYEHKVNTFAMETKARTDYLTTGRRFVIVCECICAATFLVTYGIDRFLF